MLLTADISAAEDPQKPIVPVTNGRPVYALPGTIAVLPELVERPPDDYKSSLGPKPFGVITIEEKVLGEIYFFPLDNPATDEAAEMARSVKAGSPVTVAEKGQEVIGDEESPFVTLKVSSKGKFGNPYIIHSVYLPRKQRSVTFKLVASEKDFSRLKPLFYAVFDTGKPDKESQKDK